MFGSSELFCVYTCQITWWNCCICKCVCVFVRNIHQQMCVNYMTYLVMWICLRIRICTSQRTDTCTPIHVYMWKWHVFLYLVYKYRTHTLWCWHMYRHFTWLTNWAFNLSGSRTPEETSLDAAAASATLTEKSIWTAMARSLRETRRAVTSVIELMRTFSKGVSTDLATPNLNLS